MNRLSGVLLLSLLLAGLATATPSLFNDDMDAALRQADADDYVYTLVFFSPEPDGQDMANYVQDVPLEDRAEMVWSRLSAQAEDAQADVLDLLYAREQTGDAHTIQPLVLVNAVYCWAKPSVVREIATRQNVRKIIHLEEEQVLPPADTEPAGNQLDEIVWGVERIGAPDVWDMGYTGEGVVVCVLDTGLRYTHWDVEDHLWDGGPDYPNHGWDFYNVDDDPVDDNGHGSRVAGIVASDGSAGSQCGVAPDATLMPVKIISGGGASSYNLAWAGLDWALVQGTDVVILTINWHDVDETSRRAFRDAYDQLAAAGIISVNAAGGDGDNPGTYPPPDNIGTPGSVPPPWLHPDQAATGSTSGAMTSGATDNADVVTYISGRGPCSWENVFPYEDFPFNGGADPGLIKPDVAAPGINIKSIDIDFDTDYSTMSGTSAATAHVAGVCALLLSINPDLTIAEIDSLIETTALDLGDPGKDNAYGAGRVDAYAAAQAAGTPQPPLQIVLTPSEDPYIIPATGGTLVFDAEILNDFDEPTLGQVKTQARLPNGNMYPLNTYNLTFLPHAYRLFSDVTQDIPAMAPAGDYLFIVRGGLRPWVPLAFDSFAFSKEAAVANGDKDWSSSGWNLEPADTATLDNESAVQQPAEFALSAAYPNPFNPATTLTLTVPVAGQVRVAVYDLTGREVTKLAGGEMSAGAHMLTFDGSAHASGVYFVRAELAGQTATQKVLLLK
ncbi:S8 family peptidase [bacterium]|nr:S8 family peptidase [bacterium]